MNMYDQIEIFCDRLGIPTPMTVKARDQLLKRMVTIGWLTEEEVANFKIEEEKAENEGRADNRYSFWRTKRQG